ncbi:MAG: ArsA-related P-loop ATPase [Candidatus Bathyarchaeota archaeon]
MKIAVTGKGGVGKTTIAAGLARSFARKGKTTIALDMDPSPNMLSSLGCEGVTNIGSVKPLMELSDLIQEKTGAPPEGYGLVFKINPKVDDILERFGVRCKDGVKLLVLGTMRQGGSGCFCPANTLARMLIDHLSGRAEILLMDMEAGVEHLGRGTTRTAEILLIVVEPSQKSLEITGQIKKMATDLGVKKILAVINKLKSEEEKKIILNRLQNVDIPVVCSIPNDEAIVKADLEGTSIFDMKEGSQMVEKMEELSRILEREIPV